MREVIRDNIDKCGQHMFGVGGEFMYTIGNHEKGLPELLCIGPFPPQIIGLALNTIGKMQRDNGEPFKEGLLDIDWNLPVKLRKCGVRAKQEYTFQASLFYDHQDYDVMQVMICDKDGRFPDDDGVKEPFNVEMP